MHLLNHLKSFQASSKIVSSNDELLDSISCIAPINQLFEVTVQWISVVFEHSVLRIPEIYGLYGP